MICSGVLSGEIPAGEKVYTSTGQYLRVQFVTDGSSAYSGWTAVFDSV